MIDSVRNLVLSVLNKNNYGYVSPSDFNLFAKQAQLDLFEEYFSGYAKEIAKQNTRKGTTGATDESKRMMEVIDTFYTVVEDTITEPLTLPNDVYTVVRYMRNGREAERVDNSKQHLLAASLLTAPSNLYPAYVQRGNTLDLLPDNLSNVELHYIRVPRAPMWTYNTLSGGEPVFSQSVNGYQDFELPLEDEPRLALKVLQYAGVSIRELDVYNYSNAEEMQADQKKS